MESIDNQNLEKKTMAIVEWLNLDDVPSAASIDPENKMGLQNAFKKNDGVYPDPIPEAVMEKAKKNLVRNKVILLNSQKIGAKVLSKPGSSTQLTTGGKSVPLFKEQVYSAGQYLSKLGFEPEPKTVGDTFILSGQRKMQSYSTKDPNVRVEIQRNGQNENSPVNLIQLVIN
ncbi:MAG TPA: hypothetical protein VKC53_03220 [Patescibacteria group bacterium]|nr:hypothetical protein [Patescibacteria group bacterium]